MKCKKYNECPSAEKHCNATCRYYEIPKQVYVCKECETPCKLTFKDSGEIKPTECPFACGTTEWKVKK